MTDTTKPTVYEAIAAVMAELPGIGKGTKSPEGYTYRGIEAITQQLQPLLAKHGIIIVPQTKILDTVPSPAMKDGWQDVTMRVKWNIYGPDGSHFDAVTHGIGRDRSDKGSNKAQTQAYKYLLLHLFCIADAKDEVDSHAYESGRAPEVMKMSSAAAKSRLLELTGGDKEAATMAWKKAGLEDLRQVTEAELNSAIEELRQLAWTWAPHGPDDDPGPGEHDNQPAHAGGVELDTPGPHNGGNTAGGAATTTPVAADNRGDAATGREGAVESREAAPRTPAPPTTIPKVAMKAGHVFRDAYDAAPRGTKTKIVDQLRHALIYACTKGGHISLKWLTSEQLLLVSTRLEDIGAGRLTYEYDIDPAKGVTFTTQTGTETYVPWLVLKSDEADE